MATETNEAELEPSDEICKSIRLINNSIRNCVEKRMAPLGLTAAQLHPIALIGKNVANTPAAIAQIVDTDTGGITRTLDRLEKKGFLTRHRCQDDRRVVKLELTDKGFEVANLLMPTVKDVFAEHLAGFSAKDLDTLKSLLKRIENTTEKLKSQ